MDCQKLILYGILLLVGVYVLKDVCGIKVPFIEGFGGDDSIIQNVVDGVGDLVDPNGVPNGVVPNGVANGVPNGVVPNGIATNGAVNDCVPLNGGPVNGGPPQIQPPVQTAPPVPPVQDQVQEVYSSEPEGNEIHQPVEGIQTAPSSCYPQNQLKPADLLPEGEADEIQNFASENITSGEGILKGVNFLDAGFHVGVNTVGQSLRNANLNLRAEPPNPRIQVSPWMNSTIDVDLGRKPLSDDSACNQLPPGQGAPVQQ